MANTVSTTSLASAIPHFPGSVILGDRSAAKGVEESEVVLACFPRRIEPDNSCETAGLVGEEGERDGGGHCFVACGGGVKVVAAIVGGEELVGVLGVADYGVEVDDSVEVSGGADPLVDGLAVGFTERA